MATKVNKLREFKGQSLIEFPNEYVMVDIETTGLSPNYDEIIEISALKIANGEVISEFSELIKPEREISDFISKLTGITNEMVKDARNIKAVIKSFKEYISNDDILMGYNVNFDINFLYDNSLKNWNEPLSNNFVDVMRIAKASLKGELDSFRLKKLAKYYGISTEGMHRGVKDCRVTDVIYNKVRERILETHETYENFIKIRKKAASASISTKLIKADTDNFDVSHSAYDQTFVFTGTLEKLLRKEAMQIVVNHGGKVTNGVTKETNFLVMGNLDYTKTKTDEKSSKIIKAEALKLKGQDIEIIPEDVFYDMFEEIEGKEEEVKVEPTLYNHVKAFAILLFNGKTKDDTLEYFVEHTIDDISMEDKHRILGECFKEGLLEIQKVEETLYNHFEKMKVPELKNRLEEKNIEPVGKKSDLAKKLSENSSLEENNLNSIIITTDKGALFRKGLDYKKAMKRD